MLRVFNTHLACEILCVCSSSIGNFSKVDHRQLSSSSRGGWCSPRRATEDCVAVEGVLKDSQKDDSQEEVLRPASIVRGRERWRDSCTVPSYKKKLRRRKIKRGASAPCAGKEATQAVLSCAHYFWPLSAHTQTHYSWIVDFRRHSVYRRKEAGP